MSGIHLLIIAVIIAFVIAFIITLLLLNDSAKKISLPIRSWWRIKTHYWNKTNSR